MKLQLLVVLTIFLLVDMSFCCPNVDSRRAIKYRLVKSYAKSKISVMTRRQVSNIAKCKDFAESKQALAFNFERSSRHSWDCMLLRCSETKGRQELINATKVDYYSAYSNYNFTGNVSLSCVDEVGLFLIYEEKQNFTNARKACRKIHGFLADVTSEARTNGLAELIGDVSVFVGLSNEGSDRIWKNEFGDRITCFEYRAWATGEPSHSRGCVALFRVDRKSDPIWKVVDCSTELPYICEMPRLQEKIQTSKRPFFSFT